MCQLIKSYSSTLGNHRNNTRVWIESKKILETSLAVNMTYSIDYDFEKSEITLSQGVEKKITLRKRSNRAVIDLNNQSITKIFENQKQIVVKFYDDKIVISPLKEELDQTKAKNKANSKTPTFIEVFAGGGTLMNSLSDAGLIPVAAVELEDKYLENIERNYPDVPTFCGDLAKLDISLLPNADIVSGGIPCEGYSASGLKKREDHPTGSLGFYFLKIIDAIRPAMVLIEEVPGFKNSAMAAMTRYVLTSMGYHISEKDLKGPDYGSLTKRKRFCMVASIKKKFQFKETSIENYISVRDILETPLEDRVWLDKYNSDSIAYSLEKEQKHIEKGDGFRLARTYLDDTVVATVTKGYYKSQLTNPILVHPDDETKFSWFTPRELARINGLPEDFMIPEVKTTAGEVIGQGVCYPVFNSLGKEILEHFIDESVVDRESVNNDAFNKECEDANVAIVMDTPQYVQSSIFDMLTA